MRQTCSTAMQHVMQCDLHGVATQHQQAGSFALPCSTHLCEVGLVWVRKGPPCLNIAHLRIVNQVGDSEHLHGMKKSVILKSLSAEERQLKASVADQGRGMLSVLGESIQNSPRSLGQA